MEEGEGELMTEPRPSLEYAIETLGYVVEDTQFFVSAVRRGFIRGDGLHERAAKHEAGILSLDAAIEILTAASKEQEKG